MKQKKWNHVMVVRILFGCVVIGSVVVLLIDLWVVQSTKNRIFTVDQLESNDYDCILVLGAGVWENNQPSPMLKDRLDKGVELFKLQASDRLLMSGDHGTVEYDEVNVMKDVAIEQGIASSSIFMDHAGFSTYDSLYRAKAIFGATKIIIVTQQYHLYRALYIARSLGIDAIGVAAEKIPYSYQWLRDAREILARNKDVLFSLIKPEAKVLGDPISLDQSGDVTNDRP